MGNGLTAALGVGDFRASSCDGKRTFDSFRLASDVAGKRNRNNDESRGAYRCRFCRKWHLGTDIGSTKRKRAAEIRNKRTRRHHDDD